MPAMKLDTLLHLAKISLLDTISILDSCGVIRCWLTVHYGVQESGLHPLDGANPDHVAVDETVIQLNQYQYRLYAAFDPAIDHLLHVRLYPTRIHVLTEMFLDELREKHLVKTHSFSSTEIRDYKQSVDVIDHDSSMKPTRITISSNASSEK